MWRVNDRSRLHSYRRAVVGNRTKSGLVPCTVVEVGGWGEEKEREL